MAKVVWTKFWTRDFSLFRHWVCIESGKLPFYKKNFGKIFNLGLTVSDGQLVAYYHGKAELEKMSKLIFNKTCKKFQIFQRYAKSSFGWMQDFIDLNNKLNNQQVDKLTNKKLALLFRKWYKKYLWWQASYYLFVLEPICSKIFSEKLEFYLRRKNRINELDKIKSIITSPESMNAVALEQICVWETAVDIKKYPEQKSELLQKYYQKFLWIPCYDIKDKAYEIEHFKKNIEKLGTLSVDELQKKLKEFQNNFKRNKNNFDELLKSISDKHLVELCKIMHSLVYYKDRRDDKRREAGFVAKKFMNIVAVRLGLTLEEVNYLTPPEVLGALKGRDVSKTEIRNRIPSNYILMSTSKMIDLFTDRQDIKKIIAKQLQDSDQNSSKIIKGIVGSKGKARGTVKIVRHSVSLSKIETGDILVAVTTHPEYVPAMKKSAAIVTDEGGITSHAAIMARELHKPCIVATSNATRLLKDGDTVEVDAVRGIVEKINKKD